MDKTIRYYEVLMIRKNSEFFRKYKPPIGYTIKSYEKGMEDDWARIETSAGEFENYNNEAWELIWTKVKW